ncbi:type II secretion system protein [Pseudothermotoga elfii]|jgi:prepilin-type N-terminal cleavage/methylation domain-containing protein|uniref:type II secretion system protein n=1 Tax=Pseudothermotoga elfii TaxID=38322 RepID=UPI0003FEB10A|nr:prepilin-type N-terminal cleavage/methylation domain-containing protein [Pseudothermotoga elfii]
MRKGFTLIELLIVLAVIAALMAVVTPIALNAVAQAKATQVASNFRNIKSAIESYVNVERGLPSDLNALVTSGYLSSAPSDFSVSFGTFDTSGVATATITYSGTVDTGKLENVYSEVDTTSSSPTLDITLRKWW